MISNNSFISKYHILIFILTLIGVYGYFNYYEILFYRPQSIHQWRQTDCLSLTLSYFNQNLPFLQPKLHHLNGNDGKTVGEFPILYFITANLYSIFGEKEFILRLINLIIFSTGLIYLYKLIYNITSDFVFSIIAPLLFLSSTIIIYYANNFLPDTPSLGLTFISWYFFYRHYSSKKLMLFIVALFLITLAGLIKTTALITAATIGIFFVYNFLKSKSFKTKELLLISLPFLICGLWILYARHYKTSNENFYLLMDIKPIWNESLNGVQSILKRFTTSENWGWKKDFYSPIILYSTILSIPLIFVLKINKQLKFIAITSTILSIIYFLLMFNKFYHHDYYFVHIIPYFFMIFLCVLYHLFTKINNEKIKLIALFTVVIFGLIHSKHGLAKRYEMGNPLVIYNDLDTRLNAIGIDKTKKVISISDNTYCGSLYLMNRQGWTNLNIKPEDKSHSFILDPKNKSLNTEDYITTEINTRIKKGAEFMLIGTSDELIQFIPSQFIENKIFADSNIIVYKL